MALGGSLAGTARVLLTADTAQFDRGMAEAQGRFHRTVDTVEHDTNRMSRGILSGSGAFHSLGRSIAFASTAFLGAAGFTAVVRGSIKAAEDLQTQTIRTGQVFGRNAEDIRAWSGTAVKAMHLTSAQALTLANDTGAFLKAMGLGPRVAAEYTKGLVPLGNELARLKGIDPAAAMQAINQGLVGRGRALNALGIHIDAATIKEKAYQLGLAGTSVSTEKVRLAEDSLAIARAKATEALAKYGAGTTQAVAAADSVTRAQDALAKAQAGATDKLTNAQKAIAAHAIIMDQASGASERYTKWTHTLAGEQVALKADVGQLEEGIGKALIPTLTHLVTHLTDWLGNTKNQQRVQNDFKAVLSGLSTVVSTLASGFKLLASVMGGAKNTVIGLTAAFVGFKLAMGGLKLVALAKDIGLIGTAATAAAGETGVLRTALLGLGSPVVLAALAAAATGVGGIALAVALTPKAISEGNQMPSVTTASGRWRYKDGKFYEQSPRGGLRQVPAKDVPANVRAQLTRSGGDVGGATPGHPGSSTASIGTARQRKIVNAAASQLGSSYQWGGPPILGAHTDCSGLAIAALNAAGIHVHGRTTFDLWRQGTPVAVSQLQPGDLVFYEPGPQGPNHVAIYIGDGQVIHDPHTGDHVRTASVNMMPIVGCRRYTGVTSSGTGGGGGGGGSAAAAGSTGSAGTGLVVGTAAKKPPTAHAATSGMGLLPVADQQQIAAAAATSSLQDDAGSYDKAIAFVKRLLARHDLASKKRLELTKLLAELKKKQAAARGKAQSAAAPGIDSALDAQINKAAPAPDLAGVTKEIGALGSGKTTAVVNVPGVGAILTSVSLTPTVGAWQKVVADLTKKYKAAKDRLNAWNRSLKKAKSARFPNKTVIKHIQQQIKKVQALMALIKKDIGDALSAISDLKQTQADAVQAAANEAENTAADIPDPLQQQLADAQLSGSTSGQQAALQAQDAYLAGELATGTVTAADGTVIALTPDARIAVTQALTSVRGQEASLAQQITADAAANAAAAAAASPVAAAAAGAATTTAAAGAAAASTITGQLDTVIANQQTQIAVATNEYGFLKGLRDLRSYESNVLGQALGTSIIINNTYTTAPKDPHSYSAALSFELKAMVG